MVIALGCLFAPLALVGYWAANEVSDPDGYLRNMAPLAVHPAVKEALADRVTDEITLRLRGLGVSAGGGLVQETVEAGGDEFATAWVDINRLAHRHFVAVLSGRDELEPGLPGDGVGYDLAPMYELVKRKLQVAGLEAAAQLPEMHPVARLLPASAVDRVDEAYRELISLRLVLAVMSPILIVAGVFLARDRCAAVIGAGLGVAASMLALAIVLSAVRNVYLPGSTPGGLSVTAVVAISDALTTFLRDSLRVLFTLGLLVAVVAFAVRNRLGHTRLLEAAREPVPHHPAEPTNDVVEGR